MHNLILCGAACAVFAVTSSASADLVLSTGPITGSSLAPVVQLSANPAGAGTVVHGTVQGTDIGVTLSSDETLVTTRPSPLNFRTNDRGFNDLTIAIDDPRIAFDQGVIDLLVLQPTSAVFTANFADGTSSVQTLELTEVEGVSIAFAGTDGDLLQSVSFTTSRDISSMLGLGLGGFVSVPEPASLSVLLAGGGLLLRRRR